MVTVGKMVIVAGAAFIAWTALTSSPAYADEVRDFAPNRPSRSDSPFTVPIGFIQVETDLANYTHPGEVLQTLDPTIIYGLTNRIDIGLSIGGLITQRSNAVSSAGYGDTIVKAKFSLTGDDGGPVAFAVIPYVKIPTAPIPIGDGQVEGGINMPMLVTLPSHLQLTVEPELAELKSSQTSGQQASFIGVVNLGRQIAGALSGFVELYTQTFAGRAAGSPFVTFDYGFAYLVAKDVQLDVGANAGLNRYTPALNIYSGLAFRF